MSKQCDYEIKFIIIGPAGAGKSCLLHRFIHGKFCVDSITIGGAFGSRFLKVEDKCIELVVWDTAGQERYRAITKSYYRGAGAALLVYSITSLDSFNVLESWLEDVRELVPPTVCILLVGNKYDLKEKRAVSFQEASDFARNNGLLYLETSAKTGANVEEAFRKCTEMILTKIRSGELDPTQINSGVKYGGGPQRGGMIVDPASTSKRRRLSTCTGKCRP